MSSFTVLTGRPAPLTSVQLSLPAQHGIMRGITPAAERQLAVRRCPLASPPRTIAAERPVETADQRTANGASAQAQHVAPVESEADFMSQPFDWEHQWYPVAVVTDLDPSRPTAITILGRDLVLWRDQQGDWRAFDDVCPHRLAPLSEGRLEADGTLACSYHGWRFAADGKCTAIPQATDPKAEQTACASSRSAAVTHPVTIAEDLLWVWPASGPEEHIHAAAKRPTVTEELADLPPDRKVFTVSKWFARDLPYDWTTLVENFTDPSHAPFAHHGVQGNRYADTNGIDLSPTVGLKTSGWSPSRGLSYTGLQRGFNPKNPILTHFQFLPPALVRFFSPTPDDDEGGFTCLNLFVIPLAPGRSRVISRFISTMDNIFFKVIEHRPRWYGHRKSNELFDGDNVFLHIQERVLEQHQAQKHAPFSSITYLPTKSDSFVAAFRRWLGAGGGGGPAWPEGMQRELPPRQRDRKALLNRYEFHTRNCPDCLGALRNFKILRAATAAAAGALLLALATVLGRGAPLQSRLVVGLVVGAALCGKAWRSASDWVEKFYYVPFVHQDRP